MGNRGGAAALGRARRGRGRLAQCPSWRSSGGGRAAGRGGRRSGGGGIALRSTWDVAHDLRDGRLQRILPGYEGASDVGVYAVCPRAETVAPHVRAFIAFLQRLYAPVPEWDRL